MIVIFILKDFIFFPLMLFKNYFLDYEENINFIHFGPDPAQEDVKPEFFVPSQRTFLGKVKMTEIFRKWIH